MKRIVVLGSSGSIGINTLDIVRNHPDKLQVVGLVVNRNIGALEEQIREFHPVAVCVADDSVRKNFNPPDGVKVYPTPEKLIQEIETDIVIVGISGSSGLLPTLEAIRRKRDIALATKEVLVMAGQLVISEAEKYGTRIIPIDSEHNAIYQCLNGRNREEINKIIITASGGPFYFDMDKDMDAVTPKEALSHPRWKMGDKVSVDSATLINKGFEVIEAYHLFQMPLDRIKVVIHPESILHGIIELIDGSMIGVMYMPDMRIPIQYALSLPQRWRLDIARIDFSKMVVHFEEPDFNKVPALRLCYEAAKIGGSLPAVLNAADEVCVNEFLQNRIRFVHIVQIIEEVMEEHSVIPHPAIEDILNVHIWARNRAIELCRKRKG